MNYAIIAAGEGSRLVQEGIGCPKPLVRLNGVALIDRLIGLFLRHEAASISVIVNEEMKEVQEHLKSIRTEVPFRVVVKSTPSSMHSFYEISRHLRECDRICLTTVDTVFREEEFGEYIRTFMRSGDFDGLMAVTDYIDDEKPLYVQTDSRLMIRDFVDESRLCKYVSGGVYCLNNACLDVLDRAMADGVSRMRNYQRRLAGEGLRLRAYPFSKIIDVDHAEDIRTAELFLQGVRI
ncbi:CTP:phosphocholine cytidylyltransferase [Bacteroidales bacterium Barb6XT]|nr:CTP:phosphocholine cytidylyltransferase [Bacteroidales bacterium Barb6XT]